MNDRKVKKKIVSWLEINGPAYADEITEGVHKESRCKTCGHISDYNTKEMQVRNILQSLKDEGVVGVGKKWKWGLKK